jgi:hypothetical protein
MAEVKVWRLNGQSRAGINLRSDTIELIADAHTGVQIGPTGITLIGKSVNMGTTSENIRTGGLFVMQNEFLSMIPSTIMTPIGQRLPFPPFGLPVHVAKLLAPAMAAIFGIQA